jgi:LDH2 family malate/lactate/ureidoglycolate dehydrogenase
LPMARLRAWITSASEYAGMHGESLDLFVEGMLEADLQGRSTHGVARMPVYVRGFRSGAVNPMPDVREERRFGATAMLDGDHGIGVVVGQVATRTAIELARECGVGVVGARNSGHTGMLAHHVTKAADQGMIAYFVNNGPAVMAPWGAREVRISNNPFAWGVPVPGARPLVLDMATSAAARGKVRLAAKNNETIPRGWAIDVDGQPTVDPHAAMLGSVLPMAEHKGYALAVINEVLAGVLTGAVMAPDMSREYLAEDVESLDRWGAGHLVVVLDPERFVGAEAMADRMAHLISEIKGAALAPGFDEVFIPGEPEWRMREQRVRDGVPISRSVIASLNEASTEFGIDGI